MVPYKYDFFLSPLPEISQSKLDCSCAFTSSVSPERTKAVIIVHLYGYAVDVEKFKKFGYK